MLELTKNLNSDIVLEIIKLSERARNSERMMFQKLMSNHAQANTEPIADSQPKSLLDVLQDLSDEQVIELTALMWLGRGDYSSGTVKDAYLDALDVARQSFKREEVGYLVDKPLKTYLLKALELNADSELS
ncbi:MAG TPA: DUF3775 domain-containing protein [Candidatus Melainabacteria bacterium]|nr:DUF3775 domain-containing protein [Candidatus Melainabacteria bacterium]HIN66243.1 DUF3775 domain-containing protein [Candidatus Obscuribacterales bacterium]